VFLFTSYLDELSIAGECAAEYLALYQKLIKPAHWKVYLAARGVLPYVGNLITKVWACVEELGGSRKLVPDLSFWLLFGFEIFISLFSALLLTRASFVKFTLLCWHL